MRYAHTVMFTSERMSFCSTEKGLLGWVPPSAQTGDKVCLFAGCSSPWIIKEGNNGDYVLVGDAYIHRIMYGEAMSWEGID
jgi:hypothetical protein